VTFRSQEAEDYSGERHLERNNEGREKEIYPFVRPGEAFNAFIEKSLNQLRAMLSTHIITDEY
jgi:hypothetical protein